jgi:chromosome segregation ATPase
MAKKQQQEIQRQRRSVDQKIADLQAKIASLKEREAQKQAKADPALKHAKAALKAVDKALAATEDAATTRTLNAARAILGECLGIAKADSEIGRVRRSAGEISNLGDALLNYVRNNPGQRGEEIAAAMATDSVTIRPVMKKLIAAGKVATEGQRRGMTYSPA